MVSIWEAHRWWSSWESYIWPRQIQMFVFLFHLNFSLGIKCGFLLTLILSFCCCVQFSLQHGMCFPQFQFSHYSYPLQVYPLFCSFILDCNGGVEDSKQVDVIVGSWWVTLQHNPYNIEGAIKLWILENQECFANINGLCCSIAQPRHALVGSPLSSNEGYLSNKMPWRQWTRHHMGLLCVLRYKFAWTMRHVGGGHHPCLDSRHCCRAFLQLSTWWT